MFDGYLEVDGIEILNRERTTAYVNANLPRIDLLCKGKEGFFRAISNINGWRSPALDQAPWYTPHDPDTADFYGMYPLSISGISESTRRSGIEELTRDGGVHTRSRHASKEIRVRGLLFARTDAGMEAGLAWLRSIIDNTDCGDGRRANCNTKVLTYFRDDPAAPSIAAATALVDKYGRNIYDVEAIDGLRIVKEHPKISGYTKEVEIIFGAGIPWSFTFFDNVATTSGVTPSTAAEVYCAPIADAYGRLILDPNSPTIQHPPTPPVVETMNMPTSWSRYRMTIPASFGGRHGRVVPRVTITAGATAKRMIRVRFYKAGAATCDYDGEFLLTYLPANSIAYIDGAIGEFSILKDGEVLPAGNLILGSNSRPPTWPVMDCNSAYEVVVDTVGGIGDATVITSVAIRE